ncbi:uncharacterized protein FOMMEDRAFT_27732 [Fomitiporia mediterranea MF3/22]|uniref:uncharacterized protein n=1 Tax=Fomitiporia mediterranea (strain MF3/22) TaxID=694068 RepID=UPI0004407A54|nr:uncharacterized protein FOMMEDRAFT_27732 [Fomitiporia mediterranea MF3/22]EJD03890.1 hypothetical protein FOMMEDRAFT_27732 [Fomitiporia mediterranea MF3/22]
MPKERRRRTNTHDQSVCLDKRHFTLSGKSEHVEVGAELDASANDIFNDMEEDIEKPTLKKKEKQQLKHELFLQRLESSHTPYSKSHARRLKRKAKEELAGGLQDVAFALPQVEGATADSVQETVADSTVSDSGRRTLHRKQKAGLIGEGKGVPLSEKQRRRVLKTEKIRQPLLLATPEFASNPFKALRIHAQNTLVKHEKG